MKPRAAVGGGGGGGSQTTLWDTTLPGNSTHAVISNGDKTVTGVDSPWSTRRATTALTADSYWEIEIVADPSSIWVLVGATRSCPEDYMGNAGAASGGGFFQNGNLAPTGTDGHSFGLGDVLGFYWIQSTSKLFMTKDNSTFYGANSVTDNPATGTGGLDLSTTTAGGSIYPGCSVNLTDQVLLRAGSNLIRTPLAGFTALP